MQPFSTKEGPPLPLPLPSLQIFIPPLQLVSAGLWQIVKWGHVMDYGLVEEFVTMVLEIVPELMTYRERVQLTMGLRARLVLELCRGGDLANPQSIQPHLTRIRTCIIKREKEISDSDAEASEKNFSRLVQTLLEDSNESEYFFQKVFPKEYGPKYDSALQILMWEFLCRLHKLLPAPNLEQTSLWLGLTPSVLEECVQSVSHPQPLVTLLQYHKDHGHMVVHALSSSVGKCIISALSYSHLEIVDIDTDKADSDHQAVSIPSAGGVPSHASWSSESEWDTSTAQDGVVTEREQPDVAHVELVVEPSDGENVSFNDNVGPSVVVELLHEEMTLRNDPPENEPFCSPQTDRRRKSIERLHGRIQAVYPEHSEVSGEPSDILCQHSLPPDPLHTLGQSPKRSKRAKTCSVCGKIFIEAKDLTRHMRSHTEPTLYRCPECGQDFEQYEDFEKHQQNVCEETNQPWTGHPEKNSSVGNQEIPLTSSAAPQNTPPGKDIFWIKQRRKKRSKRLLPTDASNANNEDSSAIEEGPLFLCSLCGKSFESHQDLQKHLKNKCEERTLDIQDHISPQRPLMTVCSKEGTKSEENVSEISQTLSSFTQIPPTPYALAIPGTSSHATLDSLTCHLCHKTCRSKLGIKAHLITHTGESPYKCPICLKAFVSTYDLKRHQGRKKGCLRNRLHRKKGDTAHIPLTCDKCGLTFSFAFQLEKHKKMNKGRVQCDTLKCPDCDLLFGSQRTLTKHYEVSHMPKTQYNNPLENPNGPIGCFQSRPEVFKCTICENNFSRMMDLKTHYSHNFTGPYPCPSCQKTFVRVCELARHQRNVPSPYHCSTCQQRFGSQFQLTQHERVHTGEKPFLCSECGKGFMTLTNLKQHQKVHKKAEPCICSHCGKQFQRKDLLKAHMVRHTDNCFSCSSCGKKFYQITCLKRHVLSHTGQKPFLCDVCGKGFPTRFQLKAHERKHSEEQPYKCTQCGRAFKRSDALLQHSRRHTGEREYVCTVCEKRFTTSSQRSKHMAVHTGEKPFKCLSCDKAFNRKDYLKAHQRTKGCLLQHD